MRKEKNPTTVNFINVVTIPSFEELSISITVHEPTHVDIQASKEGEGCEKSFAIY